MNHSKSTRPQIDVVAPAERRVLAALSLSMLLSSLGTGIANVGLPALAQAFGASFAQVQWVVLAYLLAVTALVVGAGRLGDLTGRRRLLLAGVGLFTAASLACAFAPTLGWLVVARALQGLGAAAMMALTLAFVAVTVPQARAGRAMGLLGTMSAVGTALGPSLGGVLLAGAGWRALFGVLVPLGAVTFLMAWRHLPADARSPAGDRPRFDLAGTLLLSLSLVAYALAMTLGRGRFGPLDLGLLATAGLGFGLFLWVEGRVASPLLRPAMLCEPVLGASLAASALVSTVMMSTMVVGPFYLSGALGLDAAAVGLAMACGPLAAAFAGMPAGRLADRFGAMRMTLAGLVGMAVAAFGLSWAAPAFGLAGYLVPLVALTVGYALFQAANNTAALAGAPTDWRGVVSGMLNLSRNLGLVTGASAMGAVFAQVTAAAETSLPRPAALGSGLQATFAVAGLLLVGAAALAAAGFRRAGRARTAGAVRPGSA